MDLPQGTFKYCVAINLIDQTLLQDTQKYSSAFNHVHFVTTADCNFLNFKDHIYKYSGAFNNTLFETNCYLFVCS